MGAYYEPRRSSPKRRKANPIAGIAGKLKDFYKKSNQERNSILQESYALAEKKKVSIIDALTKAQGLKGLKKQELEMVEIEMKLSVPETGEKLTDLVKKFKPQGQNFLMDPVVVTSSSTNYFFGTDEEESFVLVKGKEPRFKNKGPVEHYQYGFPDEEYVLRRTEGLTSILKIETDVLEYTNLVLGNSKSNTTVFQGEMKKEVAKSYVLESQSGRVYSIFLGRCTAKKRDPLLQLEIEYAGFIPKFLIKGNAEDEKEIVKDILSLGKSLKEDYGLKFIALTKYEWILGKKERDVRKEAKDFQAMTRAAREAALSGRQSFFGEVVTNNE